MGKPYTCGLEFGWSSVWICIGYSPGWQLWAYNTRKKIGRGRSPRQLSQGCYMSITASKQGYMYFIPW